LRWHVAPQGVPGAVMCVRSPAPGGEWWKVCVAAGGSTPANGGVHQQPKTRNSRSGVGRGGRQGARFVRYGRVPVQVGAQGEPASRVRHVPSVRTPETPRQGAVCAKRQQRVLVKESGVLVAAGMCRCSG